MDGINKNLKSETDIAKLIEKKDYLGAEKELNKIIKFKKDNHHTYFLLANIYALLNNSQKAAEQLKKSLNLNSDNKIAHYNLGVMLHQLGQFDEAQKSYKNALKIDPEYLHANLALALNFEKQNNLKEAKNFFLKTLSINKDFILGNKMYGKFLMKNGEITQGQYHDYKSSGIIRFKEKLNKNTKIKRLNISNDTNFIGCWNINNDDLCKGIIRLFEDRKDLHKIGESSLGKDEKVKKSTDITLDPRNILNEGFEDIKSYIDCLNECFQDYKNQWPFLKEHINNLDIPSFNLQKYEIGGHFNMMHCERSNLQSMHRVFAWMTYLNDVEDGGETYFEHFNLRIKPSIGKTLIWPAEWTHAHRGEILNKGYKYIITGWMHFPFSFKFDNN